MNHFGILVKYEWKKLLQKKIVWVTVLVIVALQIISNLAFLTETITNTFTDDEGNVTQETMTGYERLLLEKENAKKLDGTWIDDTILAALRTGVPSSSINPYQEIYAVTHSILDGNEIYDADTDYLYAVWRNNIDQYILSGNGLTEGEMNVWHANVETIETPFTYEYCLGWKEILTQALTNGILVLMLVAVCLADVFAGEHRLKTDQMILCMKNGRNMLYHAKALVGVLFGVGCAVILYGISFAIIFYFYGTEGFDAILQLAIVHAPFAISIGEAAMILFGITILSGILESAFAMYLSEYLGNGVAVMAILVGIMLLTQFIGVPEEWRVLSQGWNLLPTNLTAAWAFTDVWLVAIPGGYLTNFQFAAILYPGLAIFFLWAGRNKYKHFQVTGR